MDSPIIPSQPNNAFKWTAQKVQAARELAAGKTRGEVAATLSIAEVTIYRWLRQPEFVRGQAEFRKSQLRHEVEVDGVILLRAKKELLRRLSSRPESIDDGDLIRLVRTIANDLERKIKQGGPELDPLGIMSARLRWMILERDHFTCKYCGRSPLTHSVELHVDHVVAESSGGESILDNLITACVDCNLGKSDLNMDETNRESISQYLARLTEGR